MLFMYLHKSKRKDGRVYLSCVHGYRDGSKVRSKTIESFGYVCELEKKYPDPIAHFKAVVDEMEAERKSVEASFSVTIDPRTSLKDRANRKNFGFCALSAIYHELGLDWFFNNRRDKTCAKYNVSSILKLLVYGRILDPSSKKKTWEGRKNYFEKFDFSLDDVYRTLPTLAGLSEDLQLFLHNRISKVYGRDAELVYYDVTNYYFESDVRSDLREKGFSKDGKADPIVSMGLLTDQAGIPIAFDLFAGNTVDSKTFLPVLSRIKRNFSLKRVVVVADRGINTSDNIAYSIINKDGYLFSRSVKQVDAKCRDWVLNKNSYHALNKDTFVKSRIATRSLYLEGVDGKKKPIPVSERQVAVWSRKYARRQIKKRALDIEKAQMLIGDASRYCKATHSGAARFVKGLCINEKTGEILEGKQIRTLDIKRIEQEEKLDGFYILTTSEKNKSPQELIGMYANLWKIEDAFRVTKSDLKSRPVYLSRDDHIKAHFLTCFIALTIMRILEMKTGYKHSTPSLIEAMKRASASHLEENLWLFDYTSPILEDIGKASNIDFSRKYMRTQEIRKVVGSSKKQISVTNKK